MRRRVARRKEPCNTERKTVEVTVFVRDNVVRVVTSGDDLNAAVDEAADKVTRQLRKYKTRIVDRRQRVRSAAVEAAPVADLADLIEDKGEDEEALVREKIVDLVPMSVDEALVQIDLIGHDFYVFTDSVTGLVNVVYRRTNGGYGIITPKIEGPDDES